MTAMAVLIGIQLRMLRLLSENYHVPFYRDIVKKLISSLVGEIIPTSLATIVGSGMKLVPVVGPIIGVMSMSVFAGATTLAKGAHLPAHHDTPSGHPATTCFGLGVGDP